MHFRVDKALWSNDRTPFRIDLLPAGFVYTAPHDLGGEKAGEQPRCDPDMYQFGSSVPKDLQDKSLSLSFPPAHAVELAQLLDEFLVFQGASYFRAVGQDKATASRRAVWHCAPASRRARSPGLHAILDREAIAGAKEIVVHALLESASVTGAYRFAVRPGRDTEWM